MMKDEDGMLNSAYHIRYEKVGGETKAYLAEIPTTCAFGKNEQDAFVHLMLLLYGDREISDRK